MRILFTPSIRLVWLGDLAEARAIARLCQDRTDPIPVSSTKGATGHLLGAAGAIEAMFTIQTLHDRILPPTLHLTHPDPQLPPELDHVALYARTPKRLRYALSNSFGFGGVNVSLVFASYPLPGKPSNV